MASGFFPEFPVPYYIGLDLGGTFIKGGLLDEKNTVLARHSIPTEGHISPDHVMDRLELLGRDVAQRAGIAWDNIAGLGVGTPGPTTAEGVVMMAPNLAGWKDVPLQSGLAERTGLNVKVVNDANAAAYGEFLAGAGKDGDVRHMILLTLGTGVGGGVIINNELFIGPHGAGAELGHSILTLGGRPCGCGQRGCLEQYASATAIVREAKRRLGDGEESTLPVEMTAKDVFEFAQGGDKLADSIIDEACRYLGAGIVNFIHAFDPQVIVLGGGVANAGEPLLERVRRHIEDQMWHVAPIYSRLVAAELGNDAGFIGSAGLCRGRVMT